MFSSTVFMDLKLNLLTLNVGMRANLAGLPDLVRMEKIDIVFLQEICLMEGQIQNLLSGYKAAVNIDESNLSKPRTAIVWREELQITDVYSISPCRAQVASLGQYRLMNIYASSGSNKVHERSLFFGCDIFQNIHMEPRKAWICGGDFTTLC